MFMGIMAVPNIIALFLLSKEVRKILDDYDASYIIKDKVKKSA
jgi:alanine or glycine:cation symporter, AGCS family